MTLLSRFSATAALLGVMMFAGTAAACDYCDRGYGGHEVYSCNNALYDCRTESSYYTPRCDGGCGYGYGGGHARAYAHGYRHGYRDGFHDGYDTASYEQNDQGFYDGDHHFHNWER